MGDDDGLPKTNPEDQINVEYGVNCPLCGEGMDKKGGSPHFICDKGHVFEGMALLEAQAQTAVNLMASAVVLFRQQQDLLRTVGEHSAKDGQLKTALALATLHNRAEDAENVLRALIETFTKGGCDEHQS